MERQEHFGRRATPQREVRREDPVVTQAARPEAEPAEILRPAIEHLDLYAADAEVEREIEAWKTVRKTRKRSFREPWRTFAIASSIAFGVGNLILPASVAEVMNYVTTGLFVASIIAGFRQRRG